MRKKYFYESVGPIDRTFWRKHSSGWIETMAKDLKNGDVIKIIENGRKLMLNDSGGIEFIFNESRYEDKFNSYVVIVEDGK